MSNVNWCLMAVSFGLGLVLTLAFLIRRVKREVPVYGSGGGSAGLAGSAGVKAPKVDVDAPTAAVPLAGAPDVDAPTARVPKVDPTDVDGPDVDLPDVSGKGTLAAAAAGVAGGAAAAKLVGSSGSSGADEPYGAGSARVAPGAAAPTGWTIKGNEDSMLYHSPESPSYKQTIAELWFRDEETATAAGFARWDSGKSQRGQR
ncbi:MULTISPECIES: hypothetical protein [unclassified Mycobacterium]|uniref:channel accessory protein ArfC, sunset domain variant n=1 Tax=unclassified Mycobacterium TaxID=2642494 RepID=UPI0029C7F381|nr:MULTISPECIES: hypothetical protein [unclassified Mycobacterium]